MSKKRRTSMIEHGSERGSVPFTRRRDRDRFYKKMSTEQHSLYDSIVRNVFTMCESRAGTGKTIVSFAAMLQLLDEGKIDKVIYLQKCSARYLEHGYLAGSLEEKTSAMFTPVYDALAALGISPWEVESMEDNQQLTLTTDSVLRGVNFERAGVILDESENMDEETLRLIFTRCHDNCHVVMLGDSMQRDNSHWDNEDFIDYGNYLVYKLGFSAGKVKLTQNFRGTFSKVAEDYCRENG